MINENQNKKPDPNKQDQSDFVKNTEETDPPAPVPGTTARFPATTPAQANGASPIVDVDTNMRQPGQSQEDVDKNRPVSGTAVRDTDDQGKTDEEKDRDAANLGSDGYTERNPG